MSQNNKWQNWVIATLTLLVMTFGGLWLTGVANAQAALLDQQIRLTKVEVEQVNTDARLKEILDELKAIRKTAEGFTFNTMRP